ncbi:MAG: ribonuclease HII [Bacillota bacterium]
MYDYEIKYNNQGYQYIAGCDEAGRGPMAGPLVCAAVILNPHDRIDALYDSKALNEKTRDHLYNQIINRAIAYKVVFLSPDDVDTLNCYQASKKGMIDAVFGLSKRPDFILTDAMPLGDNLHHEAIIKGDQKSASIAAASILAKVERDRYMIKSAKAYPGYGFEKHKGYPTKYHKEKLIELGVCALHRKSYQPVKEILVKQVSMDI